MFNSTMTFKDVLEEGFKSNKDVSQLDFTHVLTTLGVALIIGLFIFAIYRFTYEGVIYSHSYNMSILLISLITTLIIMTISSNIVLSLGMVGALSIVRFRTAIKEPIDIVYMFWSIAVGITTGAGLFYLAVMGSVFIGVIIILFSLFKTTKKTYILIAYFDKACEADVLKALSGNTYVIKSKIFTKDQIELTLKIKVKKSNRFYVSNQCH